MYWNRHNHVNIMLLCKLHIIYICWIIWRWIGHRNTPYLTTSCTVCQICLDNNITMWISYPCRTFTYNIWLRIPYNDLAPKGVARLFSSCISVCVSVCMCVCVWVRPIFWYFIYRILEEISIWNSYRTLIGSLSIQQKRSRLKGQGQCHRDGTLFLKVQSSQKLINRKFAILFCRHLFVCPNKLKQ